MNEYWDDKYIGKVVYKYDETGNEIEQSSYYASGEKKYYFKYDGSGNVVEESRNGRDNDTIKEQTFKYDSIGNQFEETDYNPNRSVKFLVKKKYDENGNVDEWISYETDGRINKWSYKYVYDFTGNWLK